MSDPFFLRSYKFIDRELKEANEAAQKKAAFQANRSREEPKKKQKKGLLSKALKTASGLDDVLGDVAGEVGGQGKDISAKALKGAVKGLDTWGNQVQSVPAALFTKGVVEDGQYTTERNLIGNPFGNVQSHVKAQREAGLLSEDSPTSVFGALREGFQAANRAGGAYQQDPDIAPGVKFATGVALDPTTYIGAGALAKVAGVSKTPALKGKFLRGALGLVEGFDKPSQVAKFTIGGALGTQALAKADIPYVPEGVEQFAGGLLGGAAGLRVGQRGLANTLKEDMPSALARLQGRPGEEPLFGFQTEVVKDTDRLHHGTPHVIRKGEIVTSPRGDIGPGHYVATEGEHASVYGSGDTANVTGFTRDYWTELGGKAAPQVYRYRPTRDLFMLHWDQPIDQVETSRINNAIKEFGLTVRVKPGQTGEEVFRVINQPESGGTGAVTGILNQAGFDGMTNGSQYTVWRPNEVLESDLTPPEGYKKPTSYGGSKPTYADKGPVKYDYNPSTGELALEDVPNSVYITEHPEGYFEWENSNTGEVFEAKDIKTLAEAINGEIGTAPVKPTYYDPQTVAHSIKASWEGFPVAGLKAELDFVQNEAPMLASAEEQAYVQTKIKVLQELIQKEQGDIATTINKDKTLNKIAVEYSLDEPPEYMNWGTEIITPEKFEQAKNDLEFVIKNHKDPQIAKNADLLLSDLYEKKPYSQEALPPAWTSETNPPEELLPKSKLMFQGNNPPHIGGGAAPEQLVQPKPITPGLTKAEQIGNAFTEAKKFIIGKGIKNDAQATPLAKETVRINTVLRNQGNTLARLAQRAERLFNVDETGVSQDLGATLQDIARNYSSYADRLTPEQTQIMETLRYNMDAYEELHSQFGLELGKLKANQKTLLKEAAAGQQPLPTFDINAGGLIFDDPQGFYLPRGLTNYLGEEELPQLRSSSRLQGTPGYTKPQQFTTMAEGIKYGYEYPKLSAALESYGNVVADRASKAWLDKEVEKLSRGLPGTRRRTGAYVTAGNEVISLPPEISDVLNRAIDSIHGHKSSDAAQAYTAINNVLRRMWAAGDASFVAIQNLLTSVDNPKLALKNAKATFETLKDPTVFGKFVEAHDRAAMGTGSPSIKRWVRGGLHIADVEASGTDFGKAGGGNLAERIERVKFYGGFLKHSGRLFSDSGNFNRVGLADLLYDQYKSGGSIPGFRITSSMDEDTVIELIANAANRATGYSQKSFGGSFGSALFFAPRFMQSQLETLTKAATDTGVEGQVARRQLMKLVAVGSAITVAANEARGKETEFNPLDSNFMRIRDVMGNDISLFGPWDTMVRGLIKSAPHQDEQGNWEFTGGLDFLRSKTSPVIGTAVDVLTGENVVGEPTRGPQLIKNTVLPFGLREIGQENPLKTGLGLLGVKASPLTARENLDRILSNAGINKSDPEYLIKRRDYLAKHPEDIPESKSAEFKRGQEVRGDISTRRKLNDTMTQAGDLTLVEFRENRKLLLTEQRNRLDEILPDFKPGNSKQDKWLSSYFKLFDDPKVQDPITNELDGDKFDELVASWTNKNGTQALDFVQRYLGTGLSPVESAYYNDLRKLSATGYFDMPKYQGMESDLDEDTIDSLVAQVDGFRAANPSMANVSWAKTAQIVLGYSLDQTELMDIIRSRSDKFQNPERVALKKQYGKELLWFNPRANWSSYTDYKPGQARVGSKSGFKLDLPRIKIKLPKLNTTIQ